MIVPIIYVLVVAVIIFQMLMDDGLGTQEKILWLLALILAPVVGLVAYLVQKRRTMGNKKTENHDTQDSISTAN
ncbi:PLDc N-terminal domain-containing protein [Enteractinococcus helveticum]|nr:PLDc N-terminal domain-containing protein [Enteractinococcus helveticum]